ncbi:MAG: amidohydrolase [Nitrospiraceae bacterium]|nr:amidohydrolase [Nitrospiraceae bacterium]
MKSNADIIIRADHILTMDDDLAVIETGAVAVKDGRIAAAGPADEIVARYESPKVIGGKGFVAFPGLVNTHTHSPMVYFRGLADDLPLKEWLEKHVWPAEEKWLSPEFVGDAVELACLEMIKSGITAFNDMYFYGDRIAATAKEIGMRAVVGAGILDFPTRTAQTPAEYLEKAESFIRDWKGDGFITPCVAPHSAYACSPDTLRKAKTLSEAHGVPLHIHISETEWEVAHLMALHRTRPVTFLDSIGFLDKSVTAAHCVWIEDEEIDILAKKGVAVSHCVESNLKLASGFAPVVPMLAEGIRVTFGTDGAASNNDLSLLSEMGTAAKVHKALAKDPTALGARQVALMATRWGAEALGMGDRTGSIQQGKDADIVLADIRKPHLAPMYDVYSHLVYSMNAADIDTVIVGGKIILQGRRLLSGDEDEILRKASSWCEKIRSANTA